MEMHKHTRNEIQLMIVAVGLLFLGGITIYGSAKHAARLQHEYTESRKDQEALTAFFTTDDKAKAVYVFNATKNKVLFERNADTPLPLASVAKLATALTVHEVISKDEKIIISQKALQADGDNGLVADEVWSRDPLIGFMLLISSNDAAIAFKEHYEKNGKDFMVAMNDVGQRIGLTNTRFYNPAGLDINGKPGAVGSAKDVSTLILSFLATMQDSANQTIFPQHSFSDTSGKAHLVSNTNDLSASIDTLLASKTGYTNLAGGNLVIAYRMPVFGDTIVIVVLGSTREGRFVDIESYMRGVEQYYKISQK